MSVSTSSTAAAQSNLRIVSAPAAGKVISVYGVTGSAAGAETVTYYDGEGADTSEVLTIDRGTSTGGDWLLTVDSNDSAAIQWNDNAATVKSSVEGISGITTVSCTGTGSVGDPWIVTFTTPKGALVSTGTGSLTGGDATLTVTETTAGADQGSVVWRQDFLAGGAGTISSNVAKNQELFRCSAAEKLSIVSTATGNLFVSVRHKEGSAGVDVG